VIYQLEGEYKALSLRCTHLGCTLEDEGEIFSCPCHGSVFDKVEINEAGNLIVHMPGAGQ